jgi:hypothetical protein
VLPDEMGSNVVLTENDEIQLALVGVVRGGEVIGDE